MADVPRDNDDRREHDDRGRRGPIQEYAGGEIRSYRGIVNRWLLVVYAILAVWAVYYLIVYWSAA
ncbi:MAG TPA: hypothetical protein VGU22_14535 [Methylomirabilota bacterium]|jgi:hypothetical protein|nr:hypothetical protein [Methylomirabilota bacterium]